MDNIVGLINGELAGAEDQNVRDILADMKASCTCTVDLGQVLDKCEDPLELPLKFLKKTVSFTKNLDKFVEDASSYIRKYCDDVRYRSNVLRLLNVLMDIPGNRGKLEYPLVSRMLVGALASHATKALAYETLISYSESLGEAEKVDCLNKIYTFCNGQHNLDIFCALLSHTPTKLFYSENACFNKEAHFWEHLEALVSGSEPHLKKQGEYILSKYVEHSPSEAWQAFFMLLDVGKEKQLHLVSPAVSQLKYMPDLPFIWQKCIFKMYLSHSQSSIVYRVAIEILKGEFPAPEILQLLFVAINRNEYSELSCEAFEQLRGFSAKLDAEELKIVIKEMAKVAWNPPSFLQVLRSVLTPQTAPKVHLIEEILTCASRLPHVYIRSQCLGYVVKLCWDGEDFDQLAKMVSISKAELKTAKLACNVRSVVASVVDGRHVRLGLAVLKHLGHDLWSIFQAELGGMDPNAALCVWSCSGKGDITEFVQNYFDNNLCEEFFDTYVELIHNFPISPEKAQEMVFSGNNCYSTLQQAASVALTRRFDEMRVTFSLFPQVSVKNVAEGSSMVVCAKGAVMARTFAAVMFDQIELEAIEAGLVEEMLPLLLDFQSNNKDLLEIYKSVGVVPSRYARVVLDCLYAHLTRLKKDQYFKSILIAFIAILFSCKDRTQMFDVMIRDLLGFAEIHPLVRLRFIELIPDDSLVIHLPVLVDLYLQGFVLTKDERNQYNVCQMFAQDDLLVAGLDLCNPNLIAASARLSAVKRLLEPGQKDRESVVELLIERYMKHFKKRHFPDSKVHYEKLRIVQAILLVCNRANANAELCKILESFSVRCLSDETNQPCVRQLLTLILGISASPLEVLDRIHDAPVSALANLIPALHRALLGKKHAEFDSAGDEGIWERVIRAALPWTMGPNFRLRTYAQELIRKILEDSRTHRPGFHKKYEHLGHCFRHDEAYRNALKTDVVFFDGRAEYHPMRIISGELALVQIPVLNEVHPSEWECSELIIGGTGAFSSWKNPFSFSTGAPKNDGREPTAAAAADPRHRNETSHVQKKFTPRGGVFQDASSQPRPDFVLVASLLSKPQNLGGLTRTCEVFGIRDVTFDDVNVTTHKEFRSLSVSSEGRINAIGVRSTEVREYVGRLRRDGFCVVGAEQTAGSERLDRFRFPRKVALVLGNEKTGIPPDVIPLLDKCLEIPQLGQTRSLNVHVAGATFIWEYAKQHLVG